MLEHRRRAWTRPLLRAVCLMALAFGVSGCVVYPAFGPHWHYYRGY